MNATTTDIYPSRQTKAPRMADRQDPVAYGEIGPSPKGPLSHEQLAEYEEQGFFFFESFFADAELSVFRKEVDRVCSREDVRAQQAVRTLPEILFKPNRNKARAIFGPQKFSVAIDELFRDQRLVRIAMQVLDSAVYVHQAWVDLKPGFAGEDFYWHSDFETWHVDDGMPRMRALTCLITLTESNSLNGPLLLIPGSHRHYVACEADHGGDRSEWKIWGQASGVPDQENLERLIKQHGISVPKGPAGSLLVLDCNTIHGANSNITPWPRNSILVSYNSVENALEEPFGGGKPRPEFIAARKIESLEPIFAD